MFSWIILAAVLVWTSVAAFAAPPNILLFLADDTTFHDFACYGNEDVRTPNVDRLAREGMRFEACYNSSPMCAPTRMSLYTGQHPVRNGAWPNHGRVYDHVRSLPHYLGDLGYRVAILGKRHEAPKENFPFEMLGGRHHDNGKGLDLDLDKVKTFLEETGDRPFCLVVASNQAHIPWNRGDPSTFDPSSFTVPPYLVDTPETREALARYYAEIEYMDSQLGMCLRHLENAGRAEDTVVVFLSEQGSQFPFCKWTCYETGLRSACVVRWPGVVKPGQTSEALVQYVDVLPTFLEMAGEPSAAENRNFDGRSILPILRGERVRHHDFVPGLQTSMKTYVIGFPFAIRTIRDDRHRLVWNLHHDKRFRNSGQDNTRWMKSWRAKADNGNQHAQARLALNYQRPEFELYDLERDPCELHNLAADPAHAKTLRKLQGELERWMKQQDDQGVPTELQTPDRLAGFQWPSKP